MTQKPMQTWWRTSYLAGESAAYLEELYENYLENPQGADAYWRDFFTKLPAGVAQADVVHSTIQARFRDMARKSPKGRANGVVAASDGATALEQKLERMAEAYRQLGHRFAKFNPLLDSIQNGISHQHYGFTEQDLGSAIAHTWAGERVQLTLREWIDRFSRTYMGSIGAEFMHVTDEAEQAWLLKQFEEGFGQPNLSTDEQRALLERLVAAEGLEKYLHSKYVGQKRFSLEGGETLIPLVEELVHLGASEGVQEVVMGMAHRGRLNILVNVLGKLPAVLFEEFEGKHAHLGSGDVKYHQGFSTDIQTAHGEVHFALSFNPSHLEIVAPVVAGSVKARQVFRQDTEGREVMAIQVHGDAAFAGQGVVMETMNLSQLRGYKIGGSIHVVINNQIGFTTSDPLDARSTEYCTDIAKMFLAPVLHVNGDDPEAAVFAARIALLYRARFHKEVVIDLVCYRRHGHNEADEPMATQPQMYQFIRAHAGVAELYAQKLLSQGTVKENEPKQWLTDYRASLDVGQRVARRIQENGNNHNRWQPFLDKDWRVPANTGVASATLQALAVQIATVPTELQLHPRVAKIVEDRRKMTAGEQPLDWGYAETLAYATLLHEGYPVRLTGQDTGRGTFFHRHAVWHDQGKAESYIALQHLPNVHAWFHIYDSILSEEAALAFEYGYASVDPAPLIIWEAQFGDFVNGAQVVIDQFISSGEQKWGRLSALTLLLPHGYEGQGPEHSSARLERFLQLSAEHNIQVCVPTTPAQIFHLLRRQVIRQFRKPLVVMTPKSLLRHRLAVSTKAELSNGAFMPVIDEVDALDARLVKRVVLCSGKVYYDLLEQRREREQSQVAIIRIEQLYPFPDKELIHYLKPFAHVKDFVWCQEEPINQGAWYCSQHHLYTALKNGQTLRYVGREASASPAAGHFALHVEQQKRLVDEALTV